MASIPVKLIIPCRNCGKNLLEDNLIMKDYFIGESEEHGEVYNVYFMCKNCGESYDSLLEMAENMEWDDR